MTIACGVNVYERSLSFTTGESQQKRPSSLVCCRNLHCCAINIILYRILAEPINFIK